LDAVAYVRFASVYRDFREVADFHEVLGEIAAAPEVPRPSGDGAFEPPAERKH
jgi:transcriptional repressor NrdR